MSRHSPQASTHTAALTYTHTQTHTPTHTHTHTEPVLSSSPFFYSSPIVQPIYKIFFTTLEAKLFDIDIDIGKRKNS